MDPAVAAAAPPSVVGSHKAMMMMPYLNSVQGTLQQPQASNSSYSLSAHLLSSHHHQQQQQQQQRHATPPMSSSSYGDMGSSSSGMMMTSSSHYSMMMTSTDPSPPLQSNNSSAVEHHLYSSPHHSTTGSYEYPNSAGAADPFGAPISSTQLDSWSSPSTSYRPGLSSGSEVDHLYNSSSSKAFSSSIHDKRRGHDISTDSQVDIVVVDGALELSAGAKEFVPSSARLKEYSPGYGASMSNPAAAATLLPMPALTPAVSSLGLALHQHQPLLYQPSSNNSSSASLLGTGSALIGGQPLGLAARGGSLSSIPPMPPLAINHHVNQSAWKLYHHNTTTTDDADAASTPFMNMNTGGGHLTAISPSVLDPIHIPMQQQQQQSQGHHHHSVFMSDYDLLLHSNSSSSSSSFNAAAVADSDAYEEYYDPSDAIMTDIDSFLSMTTDN